MEPYTKMKTRLFFCSTKCPNTMTQCLEFLKANYDLKFLYSAYIYQVLRVKHSSKYFTCINSIRLTQIL